MVCAYIALVLSLVYWFVLKSDSAVSSTSNKAASQEDRKETRKSSSSEGVNVIIKKKMSVN